jgi:hypothetical protein
MSASPTKETVCPKCGALWNLCGGPDNCTRAPREAPTSNPIIVTTLADALTVIAIREREVARLRPLAESWESYEAAQDRKGSAVETTGLRGAMERLYVKVGTKRELQRSEVLNDLEAALGLPGDNPDVIPEETTGEPVSSGQTFADGTRVRFIDHERDHAEWIVKRTHQGWCYLYAASDATYTHHAKPEELKVSVTGDFPLNGLALHKSGE